MAPKSKASRKSPAKMPRSPPRKGSKSPAKGKGRKPAAKKGGAKARKPSQYNLFVRHFSKTYTGDRQNMMAAAGKRWKIVKLEGGGWAADLATAAGISPERQAQASAYYNKAAATARSAAGSAIKAAGSAASFAGSMAQSAMMNSY